MTSLQGLALFSVYLSTHDLQDNQVSVLFIQIKDKQMVASLAFAFVSQSAHSQLHALAFGVA